MAILDTTLLIDLMRERRFSRTGSATQKIAELVARGEDLFVSTFTVGELFVGVAKGNNPLQERQIVESCLVSFIIVDFEASTARIFGSIVGYLEINGQTIGDMDALIGSVALESKQILITRNVTHFSRIPGLVVETY